MIKPKYIIILLASLGLLLVLAAILAVKPKLAGPANRDNARKPQPLWQVRSIDTVKFSRDLAMEKLSDPSFDKVIDQQVRLIAQTGATHVALGTPYDEKFVPYLKRWVVAARKYHLNIWFRGNFSGWEGWFGYQKINRDTHLSMTRLFILSHPDLFADGDIFTACPECENGGPGDPRNTGDISGYRNFLTAEYGATSDAFKKINKNVRSNFDSMNLDVARKVMDKKTTEKLNGVVTVDHYISSPSNLVKDVGEIAQASGGKIVLGEFGAPIPDINGQMTEAQQAEWVKSVLDGLSGKQEVIGLNYWTGFGGSTKLWNEDYTPKPGASILEYFYKLLK